MEPSSTSNTIRRTSDVLRRGASSQVTDYEQRFSSLKTLYEDLLSDLIQTGFSHPEAHETAKQFFNSTTVRFAGVDGTMYSRPLFDLVIFFGGACASTGQVTFNPDSPPTVEYDMHTVSQSAGISSVVPVYVNEIVEIDHAFSEAGGERALTDQSIIDNSTIANWIMTFAEYYLAYKLATSPELDTRVILLDRSLSAGRAGLTYETAKRELWKTHSSLIGYKLGQDEPLDMSDLTIARQRVCNEALGLPPPRGDYLPHAIVQQLKDGVALKEEQILAALGITDQKRARRAARYFKRLTDEHILTSENGAYTLNPKYTTTMRRVKNLVLHVGERFFSTQTAEADTSSVMKILKDGREQWLTTVDIAFLCLFTFHMLMEECWQKRILLVGITKDTAARDFKRQLIPIMHDNGLITPQVQNVEFDRLPNTDRMILQSASIFQPERIRPPWSLIEYDSAFRTMIPDRQGRKGHVQGAIKNRTSLEKAFLKTYVQLSQAKTDPLLRSNVLLIDRLAYPEHDCRADTVVRFVNEFGGAEEPLETILFRDKSVPNSLQNMVMTMLVAMAPSSIPEAFGHNKPLFIADKIAKWNYSQFKCVVDTTADWILNNHRLRKFIFYMSTFRERRATIEAARREQV